MLLKLNEYKGKLRDAGKRVSNEDIANATGINLPSIEKILAGKMKEFRGEYLDAFAADFATELGVPVSEIDLIAFEPITLPLSLNIRPDRHGKRVGEASTSEPTENQSQPLAQPSSPVTAPTTAAIRERNRAALLPPLPAANGGTPGAREMEREAALEERRRALLGQARGE